MMIKSVALILGTSFLLLIMWWAVDLAQFGYTPGQLPFSVWLWGI